MVEAGARTTERLMERSRSSEAIPRLRNRRSEMLEADADNMDERAQPVCAVRRKKRPSKEEEMALRNEASKLRAEAASFTRHSRPNCELTSN